MKTLKDLKKSNSGFSLVELVVSVAILVIIAIPFAMAFITATKVNASSRNVERATTAAQTEMEYLRSANIPAHTTEADKSGVNPATVYVKKNADGTNDTSSIATIQKDMTAAFPKYTYLRDVTVDNRQFHIVATLDSTYANGGTDDEKADVNNNESTDYNNTKLYTFDSITVSNNHSNATDASFELSDVTNENQAEAIADYYWPEKKTIVDTTTGKRTNTMLSTVINSMHRKFEFEITNTEDHDATGATVYVTQVYVTSTFTYYSAISPYSTSTERQCIYSNKYKPTDATDTKKSNLQNIYISYNGASYSTRSNTTDSIYIKNMDDIPLTFHLNEGSNNPSYAVNVLTWEPKRTLSVAADHIKDDENLRTTVTTPLKEAQLKVYYSNSPSSATRPSYSQTSYTSGGRLYSVKDLINLKTETTDSSGTPTGATSRLYTVTLEVYNRDGTTYGTKSLVTIKSTLQ